MPDGPINSSQLPASETGDAALSRLRHVSPELDEPLEEVADLTGLSDKPDGVAPGTASGLLLNAGSATPCRDGTSSDRDASRFDTPPDPCRRSEMGPGACACVTGSCDKHASPGTQASLDMKTAETARRNVTRFLIIPPPHEDALPEASAFSGLLRPKPQGVMGEPMLWWGYVASAALSALSDRLCIMAGKAVGSSPVGGASV